MDLYEYQAKELFGKHGVPVVPGAVCTTEEQAEAAAADIVLHIDPAEPQGRRLAGGFARRLAIQIGDRHRGAAPGKCQHHGAPQPSRAATFSGRNFLPHHEPTITSGARRAGSSASAITRAGASRT